MRSFDLILFLLAGRNRAECNLKISGKNSMIMPFNNRLNQSTKCGKDIYIYFPTVLKVTENEGFWLDILFTFSLILSCT